MPNNKKLRRVLKLVYRAAQGGRCGVCGEQLSKNVLSKTVTIEDVHPKSKVGRDMLGNWFLSHFKCNTSKGNRHPTGCELIFLQMVNRKLGLDRHKTKPFEVHRNYRKKHKMSLSPNNPKLKFYKENKDGG